MEQKSLLKLCKMQNKLENDLNEIILQAKKNGMISKDFILPTDNWSAEYKGQAIKINIPTLPPLVENSKLANKWRLNMKRAILKLNNKVHFDKVCVLIKLFLPVEDVWAFAGEDIFYKPLIDGIGKAGIPTENCFRVFQLRKSDMPHVEVYIFEFNEEKFSELKEAIDFQ